MTLRDTLDTTLSAPDPRAGLFTLLSQPSRALQPLLDLSPSRLAGKRTKDTLTHSIEVCGKVPPRIRLRWAALLHDVGKGPTLRIDQGTITFHHHEAVGQRLAEKMLRGLGYDSDFCSEVGTLIRLTERIHDVTEWTDSAVRRLDTDAGPLLEDLLTLVEADCTSLKERNQEANRMRVQEIRTRVAEVREKDAEAARRPPLSGEDVMRLLNLKPSRTVGEALKFLLENHEGSEPEVATKALKEWWDGRNPGS